MIESIKNIQAGTPDAGSEARTEALKAVMQANKQSVGNAAEKVNSAKESKSKYEDVAEAVKALNSGLENLDVKRAFSVDKQLNQIVVTLIDKDSGDTIKQIPSEEAIRLSKNIDEMLGIMLDEKS